MATIPGWTLVPLRGTFRDGDSLRPGVIDISVSTTLTRNDGTTTIIPAGRLEKLILSESGSASFETSVPAIDDPGIVQTGWYVTITARFADRGEVTRWAIQVPWARRTGVVDLSEYLPTSGGTPASMPSVDLSKLAYINASLQVTDVHGIVASGGGGGSSDWSTITNKPSTFPPAAGSVSDATVATNAGISLDKTADSAARVAMTATERSKLAGVADGATVNATNAQLRDRATHTGTQAAGTITGLASVAISGSASDLSAGTIAAGRLPASLAFDAWQASDGTWPARPTVPTGARVNWVGYPGNTTAPTGATAGLDSYQPRPA